MNSVAHGAQGGQPSLHDAIVAFLREHPEGVMAPVLAEKFLKLTSGDPKMAAVAIRAILGADRRCSPDAAGLWHAAAPSAAAAAEPLQALPWSAVHCFADPEGRRILYLALWELRPSPSCTMSAWLVDPQTLPYDERELLQSGADEPFDPARGIGTFCAGLRADKKRLPVFFSSSARALLASACSFDGEDLPDDDASVRELLKAADLPRPRPMTLEALETTVLGAARSGASARALGERFAVCVAELLEILRQKGIETRADLDQRVREERAPLFTGKEFSYDDILALPSQPGVYGFKDKAGSYVYIGKANNLKRRVVSYFGDTEESPDKLERLRRDAHAIVTYPCGSELECLLHEYRLIKKFAPPLNKNINIGERKGTFKPVADCIVLLPHTSPGKGMSVWFRQNQKILLKAFDADFGAGSQILSELKAFFFSPKLAADASDFPEQEIAVRWIKRQGDTLLVVPVSRMADEKEIYAAMRIAWREAAGRPPSPAT